MDNISTDTGAQKCDISKTIGSQNLDTADGWIDGRSGKLSSNKKDLLKLPHIDGDLISKDGIPSNTGNAKIDCTDKIVLQKRFVDEFANKFKVGLTRRRISTSERPLPQQLLCIIDDDFLFDPRQWFVDEVIHGIGGIDSEIQDENFNRYKNAITRCLDKIRSTPTSYTRPHAIYNAKTLIICDKPACYDYKLDKSIADDIDSYCHPVDGFEYATKIEDKKIRIVGTGSTMPICRIFCSDFVAISTADDETLNCANVVNFCMYNHDYASCKYVPEYTTQLMISLDMHAIESTSFLKTLGLHKLTRHNGGLDNFVNLSKCDDTHRTVNFLAMDKYTGYNKHAQPLTGDPKKFLECFLADDSLLLLLASLRRFFMREQSQLPPIYLHIQDGDNLPIDIDIKNYTVYCNKDSFMFIEFAVSTDPATIELIKNAKKKILLHRCW